MTKRIITIGEKEFTTKNHKQRRIPICEDLYNVLRQMKKKKDDDFLFYKPGGYKYSSDHASKVFKRIIRKIGLPEDLHFHSLRHSTASNLANMGVPLLHIKDIMGHSSVAVTEIYSHSNEDVLRAAIEKLDVA